MFRIEKRRDFIHYQKKLGALKDKYFKFKTFFHLQNGYKYIRNLGKDNWNFHQNLRKKKFVTSFSIKGGSATTPILPYRCPRFHKVLCPLHPLRGFPPPGPGWKTIDWSSSQLVLMYYWLTFLNQIRFRNFRHFFAPTLKQISQAFFFRIIIIF